VGERASAGAPRSRGGRRQRRGRLSRSAEFERVFRQGRSHGNRYLVVYGFPRAEGAEPRLGVSVSRRVGGAVDRNRVKRLLREAFSAVSDRVPAGHDVVVVARPEARELAEREGLDGFRTALAELVERLAPSDRG
jgi:ribonuclease P protein component